MSILDWYQHKAEQCRKLAAASSDARERTKFQEEAVLWREIGADVIKQERASRPHSWRPRH
jgi:hypothetical protein